MAVAVAAIPVTFRTLGTDRFGLLAIAWVVFAYSTVFALGVARAATKFAAEAIALGDNARLKRVAWNAVVANLILGVCGGIAFAVASPYLATVLNLSPELQPEARSVFWVVALAIPVTLVGTALRGVLEAGYRFGLVNLVTIPASTLIYLFSAAGSTAGLDVEGIVALILISRIAATSAFALFARGVYPGLLSGRPTERAALVELVSFGGWVTVSTITGTTFAYADRIFISVVSSIGAVAQYALPYEIVARLWIIPNAVSAALFPAFSLARGSASPALASLYERALHVLLWLIQPIVVLLVLFGDELLEVWVGPDIAIRGAPILRVLAIGVLVNSLAFVPFSLIQGANRPDLTGKLQGAALLPFLAVSLVSVHILGPLGIALSLTIRLTVEAALLFATAGAVVPVVSSVHTKGSTIAYLLMAAVSLLGGLALQQMAAPLVVRALYALIAVSLALTLGLTKALGASQKMALRRAFRVGAGRISEG